MAQASKKITEGRLIWYGHVMRDGEHILRKVLRADTPGKRKRGRPKTRWKDAHANEICKVLDWERARRRTGRCGEERSSVIPATLRDGKSQRKRRETYYPWNGHFERHHYYIIYFIFINHVINKYMHSNSRILDMTKIEQTFCGLTTRHIYKTNKT